MPDSSTRVVLTAVPDFGDALKQLQEFRQAMEGAGAGGVPGTSTPAAPTAGGAPAGGIPLSLQGPPPSLIPPSPLDMMYGRVSGAPVGMADLLFGQMQRGGMPSVYGPGSAPGFDFPGGAGSGYGIGSGGNITISGGNVTIAINSDKVSFTGGGGGSVGGGGAGIVGAEPGDPRQPQYYYRGGRGPQGPDVLGGMFGGIYGYFGASGLTDLAFMGSEYGWNLQSRQAAITPGTASQYRGVEIQTQTEVIKNAIIAGFAIVGAMAGSSGGPTGAAAGASVSAGVGAGVAGAYGSSQGPVEQLMAALAQGESVSTQIAFGQGRLQNVGQYINLFGHSGDPMQERSIVARLAAMAAGQQAGMGVLSPHDISNIYGSTYSPVNPYGSPDIANQVAGIAGSVGMNLLPNSTNIGAMFFSQIAGMRSTTRENPEYTIRASAYRNRIEQQIRDMQKSNQLTPISELGVYAELQQGLKELKDRYPDVTLDQPIMGAGPGLSTEQRAAFGFQMLASGKYSQTDVAGFITDMGRDPGAYNRISGVPFELSSIGLRTQAGLAGIGSAQARGGLASMSGDAGGYLAALSQQNSYLQGILSANQEQVSLAKWANDNMPTEFSKKYLEDSKAQQAQTQAQMMQTAFGYAQTPFSGGSQLSLAQSGVALTIAQGAWSPWSDTQQVYRQRAGIFGGQLRELQQAHDAWRQSPQYAQMTPDQRAMVEAQFAGRTQGLVGGIVEAENQYAQGWIDRVPGSQMNMPGGTGVLSAAFNLREAAPFAQALSPAYGFTDAASRDYWRFRAPRLANSLNGMFNQPGGLEASLPGSQQPVPVTLPPDTRLIVQWPNGSQSPGRLVSDFSMATGSGALAFNGPTGSGAQNR